MYDPLAAVSAKAYNIFRIIRAIGSDLLTHHMVPNFEPKPFNFANLYNPLIVFTFRSVLHNILYC